MLRKCAPFETVSFRRTVLVAAVALAPTATFLANTTPAVAFTFHGAGTRLHRAFRARITPGDDGGANPRATPLLARVVFNVG